MRRRNAELPLNFTVTSASLKRSTGKDENNETWCWRVWNLRGFNLSTSDASKTLRKFRWDSLFYFLLVNSHNLRSHQKIRHAEYQGEGVTITTVRKSRSSANAQQTSFNAPATHSQASSLIISPPPPPNLLNLNSSDTKTSLPMYKSDWNSKSRWGVLGGNHFYCWC